MRRHGPGTPGAPDRRFAYAVALGAVELPRAARLGVGTEETVESGGRTVQIAYPPRQTTRSEVRLAAAVVGIAIAIWLAWLLRDRPVIVSGVTVAAAGLGYFAVRALLDLWPAEVVGTVVTVRPAGTVGDHEFLATRADAANTPAVPPAARRAHLWLVRRQHVADDGVVVGYFLVVDDGRSDRLTAWSVPPRRFRPWRPGATVRVRGQRWSRHALRIETIPRAGVLGWVSTPE
jgi:hypothetical protein